jgi:hypothetical protein
MGVRKTLSANGVRIGIGVKVVARVGVAVGYRLGKKKRENRG